MAEASHAPRWPVDVNGWRIPPPPVGLTAQLLWSREGTVWEVAARPSSPSITVRIAKEPGYLGFAGREQLLREAAVPDSDLFGEIVLLEAGPVVVAGETGHRDRMQRRVVRPPYELVGLVTPVHVPNVIEDIVFASGPLGIAFEAVDVPPAEAEAAYGALIDWLDDFAFTG